MIHVSVKRWERIRGSFSDADKNEINAAYAGESICPRGMTVDDSKLPPPLRAKLFNELAKVKE